MVSPNKQGNIHTRVQCSHTSVGLAQARLNNPEHTKLKLPYQGYNSSNVVFMCMQIYIPRPATVTVLATLTTV